MDWDRIEKDVQYQTTQRTLSSTPSSQGKNVNKNLNRNHYDLNSREDPDDYSVAYDIKDRSVLEGHVQDLKNATLQQSKKILSIENVVCSYSEIFESSTDAQVVLEQRIDGLEHNFRGNNKFITESAKERSTLCIQVKNLIGKYTSLESSLRDAELCYATKEAFSQLLDSTVDEVKSVGVAVSHASVKSNQSISLIEALIQAVHRMRGQGDSFSSDEFDTAGRTLSFEFLSSLTGERQKEQVVRLLRESLYGSVSSVAKEVVGREAESICSSVNGMLKTLNGQLMHSVEEVGKQAKAICNAANSKANQCLSITSRLEAQQGDLKIALDSHTEHMRDEVAQRLRRAMENVGEVLEDVVFVQKSTKSDLQSLDTELIQLRKTLYLEVDLLKEGQNSLQVNFSTLEKVLSLKEDPSIVDKRVVYLESEIRALNIWIQSQADDKVTAA
jgi:hypothetical protein